MVDIQRRKKLAFHLRQLSVGLTSNDEFEEDIMDDVSNNWLPDQYYRSKLAKSENDDPLIQPMLELCWGLYDDTRNHKLKKSDQLSPERLKTIACCILFLRSDREYEWPYFHVNHPLFRFSFKDCILSLLTLGQHYRKIYKDQLALYSEWQKSGDYAVWPFFRQSDYENQLQKPPFLNGRDVLDVE